MQSPGTNAENVVFFDGVCNLCNGVVNFLIRRDHKNKLKFSSLQSSYAHGFFQEQKINIKDLNTVYFYDGNSIYSRSRAIGNILKKLSYPYKAIGIVIHYTPEFLGDFLYDFIARRRYQLFGKRSKCRIPTSTELHKFIEQ
jgi:predicted DCC family thiol-disulfide oxidoreductase YuxK